MSTSDRIEALVDDYHLRIQFGLESERNSERAASVVPEAPAKPPDPADTDVDLRACGDRSGIYARESALAGFNWTARTFQFGPGVSAELVLGVCGRQTACGKDARRRQQLGNRILATGAGSGGECWRG